MTEEAIEKLLADLRSWLIEHRDAAAAAWAEGPPATPIDLATVVGQFTALRHEVNLQTRAVRTQQELAGQALEALRQALAAVDRGEHERAQREQSQRQEAATRDNERRDEYARPLLKALVDARDALALARRHVAKARAAATDLPAAAPMEFVAPPLPEISLPPGAAAPPRPSWRGWFGGGAGAAPMDAGPWLAWARRLQAETAELVVQAARRASANHAAASKEAHDAALTQWRQGVDSILAGYAMSLQRLDRAIERHGLRPIDCLGQAFDPELMEVAEVVHEEGRTTTAVVEVVRPGYLWRDKLFRFAQVKVARPVAADPA